MTAVGPHRFDKYAYEAAYLFVAKYGWYYMSVIIHKVLIQGRTIIEHAVLLVGLFSEEAQEVQNKNDKKYRYQYSRKLNHVATNEDIIHMLLLSSNSLISRRTRTASKRLMCYIIFISIDS